MLYEHAANFLCYFDTISSLKLNFMAFEHSGVEWIVMAPGEKQY